MTALTVYSLDIASVSTLTTAGTLASTTGGTGATKDTKAPVAPATGYSELFALGTTNAWSGAGSIGSPSGNGWIWDVTTLEAQTILAGNWTPTVRLQVAGGGTPSLTADIHVRAYKRSSGGTYTQIGSDMTKTAQTINSTATNYVFSATSETSMSFSTGDKLYLDIWLNVTANSGTTSANNVRVSQSSTAGAGVANNFSTVTPGYQSTTATRTVTATAAFLTTNSRTIPATAALKTTLSRTVNATAALKTTNSRTVSDTVALKTTNQRTVLDSAALKTTLTRTIPESTALKTTNARTIGASAALKATNQRTISETAVLKTTNSRTIGTSGALKTTHSRTVNATATLATNRVVPCTASLFKVFVGNAMLIVRSGETTLTLPSGHATLAVRSGETTLSIT